MPETMGYNAKDINEITKAIEALSEAIEAIEDGDMKSQLMDSVQNVMEVAGQLEARDISPEDEMLEGSEEGAGLDLGEPKPFQPEKATSRKKSPFGAVTEDE